MTRYGLFLPPFDALADPRLLAALAVDAEVAGWDGLFLWDHMTYTPPVRSILDPWITLAAISMRTERIALGVMVTPLSRRRPAVLARQAVTLDLLSRGRLVLGFGSGDDAEAGEMRRFGEQTDARVRARMLDEGLDLLHQMFSGGTVEHGGEHYTVDGVRFLPTPVRDRTIPMWIACRWPFERPLRRAARHDGVFVISLRSLDDVHALVERTRELRGHLDGFDVVVEAPAGDPAAARAWAEVPGVSWLLTRAGPYDLDADAVRTVIAAGPPARAGRH